MRYLWYIAFQKDKMTSMSVEEMRRQANAIAALHKQVNGNNWRGGSANGNYTNMLNKLKNTYFEMDWNNPNGPTAVVKNFPTEEKMKEAAKDNDFLKQSIHNSTERYKAAHPNRFRNANANVNRNSNIRNSVMSAGVSKADSIKPITNHK